MTAPLDPDPLTVEDELWDPALNEWVARKSGLPALVTGIIAGLVVGIVLGFTAANVHATPRQIVQPAISAAISPKSGPDELASGTDVVRSAGAPQEPPISSTGRARRDGMPLGGVAGSSPAGGSEVAPLSSGAPTEPAAIAAGIASWYPASGLIAAVPGWHWGDTPYRVLVSGNGHSVIVVVQDCLCGRTDRLIDLSDDAFRRLAPLSVGVLRVTVEDVGASVTPPPTSTSP